MGLFVGKGSGSGWPKKTRSGWAKKTGSGFGSATLVKTTYFLQTTDLEGSEIYIYLGGGGIFTIIKRANIQHKCFNWQSKYLSIHFDQCNVEW